MSTHIYIDTRPGASGVFAAPPAVSDYKAWLLRQYHAHRGPELPLGDRTVRMSLGGVHQALHAALHANRNGTPITVIGPHRQAVGEVIRQIAGAPA